jgi:hypothetical protein
MIRWFVSLFLTSLVFCASAAIAQQQAASITRFTRDPALLEAKEAQIVALMRQQSPDAAADVEQLFSQDLLALLAPELQRMGLDDQDMADMTTVYWVAAWEASNGVVGRQTDPALVRGARDQIAGVLGANPATQAMSDREKQDVADTMLLQAILVEARMGAAASAGAAMQTQMSDTIHAEASGMLNTDLRQVTLTAAGFAPTAGASAGASGPAGSAPQAAAESVTAVDASPAPHPENWAQMEGIYFRSYTTFGVGGMVISDFEPLALFNDGTYYEVEGDALEDIDLAASRRSSPDQWGRWARNGDGFTLTGADGRSSEHTLQGGSFFKAFPAEAGGAQLAGKYSRVSGGGDSALGGEMMIAAQTDLSFTADGDYMRASSAGAIGSGDATGVATAAYSRQPAGGAGRYRIEQHTITLTEPDGTTRRQFFAFGSRSTPPQPATNMIFLGDRVYVVMDD